MKNNNKKTLYIKIGMTSLLVVFVVFSIIFSPNILSKIKGNANSINTATKVDVKNGVVITTDLIYKQDSSNSLKLKVYNGSGKDITIQKYVYKKYGTEDAYVESAIYSNNVTAVDGSTISTKDTIDENGVKKTLAVLSNDKDYIITIDNASSLYAQSDDYGALDSASIEIGILYEMEGVNYTLATSNTKITDFNEIVMNSNNSTTNEIGTSSYVIESSDNNADSVTVKLPNKAVLDLSENLSKVAVNYAVDSNETIKFSNPQAQSSLTKKIFGLDNTSNIDEYFSLDSNVLEGFESNKGSFALSGTALKTADNITIIPGLYFTETKNNNVYSSELATPYSGTLPNFKLTVYNKAALKTAIENAYTKIYSFDEETVDIDSFNNYINILIKALNIYTNRYEYEDKTETKEVNQSSIDAITTLLNTTEIAEKEKAIYTALDAAISRVNVLKGKYPNDDFTEMNSLVSAKEENLTSNYQIKVNNLTVKINQKTQAFAYDKLSIALESAKDYEENPEVAYESSEGNTVNTDVELYTVESWNALNTIVSNAKTVYENKTYSAEQQSEILNVIDNINNAISNLEISPADYTSVDEYYEIYSMYKSQGYIIESKIPEINNAFAGFDRNLKIEDQKIVDEFVENIDLMFVNALKKSKGIFISDPSNGKSLEAVYHFVLNSDLKNYSGESLNILKELKASLYKEKYVMVDGTKYEVFTDEDGYSNPYYNNEEGKVNVDSFKYVYYTFEEFYTELGEEYIYAMYQTEFDDILEGFYSSLNSLAPENGGYEELCKYYSKAVKLNREYYENYDVVIKALWNINWEYTILDQHLIDAQTAKLKSAIESLVMKPADLTQLNTAYLKATSLNKNNYTNYSLVEDAVKNYSEVSSYKMNKQSDIDEATKNINLAISKLILKTADYSKIEVLKSQIEQLDSSKYVNFSNVNAALDSIIYGVKINEQNSVDTMYNNLKSAFDSLVKKSDNIADYSKLRDYISKIPADYSGYTTEQQQQIKSVLKEVKGLSINLQSEEQQKVDNITQKVIELLVGLNVDIYDDQSSAIVLNSLKVNGNKVNIDSIPFKYTAPYDTVEAVISVGLASKSSTYKVYGGSVILPGDNNITISVTTKDGTIYNYKLIITRSTTSDFLSDLSVRDSALAFDKTKQTYTVKVDKDTEKLDLSAIAEDENATVKVIGNENLKNGSKVTVEVTSQDGIVRVYTLDVQKSSSVDAKVILVLILILGILAGVFKVIQNKNKERENNL